MTSQTNAPLYLKNHSMFSQADYEWLKAKGYTNREILAFWNRDAKLGKSPVTHSPAFDIVGFLNN